MITHPLIRNHDEHNRSALFERLMTSTYAKVYSLAYRLCGNRADAEDLTQEACFRAFRSFEEYEGDRPFENWIFRIVTRLFLDLLRNRRRRVKVVSYDAPMHGELDEGPSFEFVDQGPTPEAELLAGIFSSRLQFALSSLSDDQRALVTLADIDNIPYVDIAGLLDRPIGTIRSRLHRTHKRIRAELGKFGAREVQATYGCDLAPKSNRRRSGCLRPRAAPQLQEVRAVQAHASAVMVIQESNQ
ncbi:MAG: RNA polymerase sigma factor [Fimbriimonadaceae bacterium]